MTTYKNSGVDIDAGNHAVSLIKELVGRTHSPNVLGGLGHFASFFELPEGYKKPVLVSCTDGVGTKIKLAVAHDFLDTIGIDLIAMCVNDLICTGAKPLFFLDYIACHKLVPTQMQSLLKGMTDGCLQADCSLVGGEMAEMNDVYKEGELDLAGFSVGVVEKDSIIDGSRVAAGDYVYGIASSGVHSNGYSLARKILDKTTGAAHAKLVAELQVPTRIYVRDIAAILAAYPGAITSIAHITGGGFAENLMRVLPENVAITIQKSDFPTLDVYTTLQTVGQVSDEEMFRVFNMGIGMVVIANRSLDIPGLIPLGRTVSGTTGVTVQ
jgi:phosphoribosylformylglycinamidine cyclo-ligase